MKKLSSIPFSFSVLGLLAACASTQPVAEWRDQSSAGRKYNHILVIGIAREQTIRRSFEDTFVAQLRGQGVTATTSTSIMSTYERITKESIIKAIQGRNIQSVLITHMVGVEQKEVYHPPQFLPVPAGHYYDHYAVAHRYAYQPGYYQRYSVVRLETNLYDATSAKPVWSMQSETVDPKQPQKLIDSKIKAVIKRLKEQKLI